MNERLELYKEILELEPHSRVFFAYAKLLEKEHRTEEALQALARGLEHQPDFLEARLYYIDLLVKNDRIENANINLHKLTDVFQNYSGFWYTWSKLAANENMTLASALGLLATLFNNPSLSFMQILQAGIQAYAPENSASHLQKATEISFSSILGAGLPTTKADNKLDPAASVESIQSILASTNSQETSAQSSKTYHPDLSDVLIAEPATSNNEELSVADSSFEDIQNVSTDLVQDVHLESEFLSDNGQAQLSNAEENDLEENLVENSYYDIDSTNAKISTNTKSMADLLAQQGDIKGAIDIYSTLLEDAKNNGSADEEEFLSAKIKNLQNVVDAMENPVKADASAQKDVLHLSPRMHSVLDRLADRLERRAQAS